MPATTYSPTQLPEWYPDTSGRGRAYPAAAGSEWDQVSSFINNFLKLLKNPLTKQYFYNSMLHHK